MKEALEPAMCRKERSAHVRMQVRLKAVSKELEAQRARQTMEQVHQVLNRGRCLHERRQQTKSHWKELIPGVWFALRLQPYSWPGTFVTRKGELRKIAKCKLFQKFTMKNLFLAFGGQISGIHNAVWSERPRHAQI